MGKNGFLFRLCKLQLFANFYNSPLLQALEACFDIFGKQLKNGDHFKQKWGGFPIYTDRLGLYTFYISLKSG